MWLKLTPTNNNPKVILRFYLEAVGELEGVFYSVLLVDDRWVNIML